MEATPSLYVFINDKFGSLVKFLKHFEAEGVDELSLVIERISAHHRKGEVFRVKADLKLPKQILHASENHEDVRVAIDLVKRKLHLEIEKYKTKYFNPKRKRK